VVSLAPVLQQALLPVGSIMAVGYLWRRLRPGGVDAPTARRVIGALVMYVFYPALAFHTVVRAAVNAELILAPLLTMFAIVLGMALAFGLFRQRFFALSGPAQLGALVIGCGLPNIVSLGIPVVQALVRAGRCALCHLRRRFWASTRCSGRWRCGWRCAAAATASNCKGPDSSCACSAGCRRCGRS